MRSFPSIEVAQPTYKRQRPYIWQAQSDAVWNGTTSIWECSVKKMLIDLTAGGVAITKTVIGDDSGDVPPLFAGDLAFEVTCQTGDRALVRWQWNDIWPHDANSQIGSATYPFERAFFKGVSVTSSYPTYGFVCDGDGLQTYVEDNSAAPAASTYYESRQATEQSFIGAGLAAGSWDDGSNSVDVCDGTYAVNTVGDINAGSTYVYRVAGTQVLTAQQPDPGAANAGSGTATSGGYGFVSAAEMNQFITDFNTLVTAYNNMRTYLRNHGMLA